MKSYISHCLVFNFHNTHQPNAIMKQHTLIILNWGTELLVSMFPPNINTRVHSGEPRSAHCFGHTNQHNVSSWTTLDSCSQPTYSNKPPLHYLPRVKWQTAKVSELLLKLKSLSNFWQTDIYFWMFTLNRTFPSCFCMSSEWAITCEGLTVKTLSLFTHYW